MNLDYHSIENLSTISSTNAGEDLISWFQKLDLKYYHDLSNGIYIRIPHQKANGSVFELKQGNTLIYNRPLYKTEIIIDIGYCRLCKYIDQHQVELNKSAELGHCPYYESAANKIIRWVKRIQSIKKKQPKAYTPKELSKIQLKDETKKFVDDWYLQYNELEIEYNSTKSLLIKKKMHALHKILALQQLKLELEHDIRMIKIDSELE